jgi:hypothetical protein
MGAVLVANLTRPVIDGVSVRVIGNGLGLQSASWMTNTGTRTGYLFPTTGQYPKVVCKENDTKPNKDAVIRIDFQLRTLDRV